MADTATNKNNMPQMGGSSNGKTNKPHNSKRIQGMPDFVVRILCQPVSVASKDTRDKFIPKEYQLPDGPVYSSDLTRYTMEAVHELNALAAIYENGVENTYDWLCDAVAKEHEKRILQCPHHSHKCEKNKEPASD